MPTCECLKANPGRRYISARTVETMLMLVSAPISCHSISFGDPVGVVDSGPPAARELMLRKDKTCFAKTQGIRLRKSNRDKCVALQITGSYSTS